MAVDRVTALRERVTTALNAAGVAHALVGDQAVAIWVAPVDPDAARTTESVDLPAARAAASAEFDDFELLGVGMFPDPADPNPRKAVHLVWAGETVKAEYPLPWPTIDLNLVTRARLAGLPPELAARLESLLHEQGR